MVNDTIFKTKTGWLYPKQTSLEHTMKQKPTVMILSLMLISATLSGCSVSQQNPQSSLSSSPTMRPTSAPSQQGVLPEVDYSIPNAPVMGSKMVSDGKRLFFIMDGYGLVSCNPDGTDVKQLLKQQAPNYHELSYSNGWLYFVAPDGIYKMKTDGKDKMKIYSEKDLVYGEDLCSVDVSLAVGDSLYYGKDGILNCLDNNGDRRIAKEFNPCYPQYPYMTSYKGSVYYFGGKDWLLMKYNPSSLKPKEL